MKQRDSPHRQGNEELRVAPYGVGSLSVIRLLQPASSYLACFPLDCTLTGLPGLGLFCLRMVFQWVEVICFGSNPAKTVVHTVDLMSSTLLGKKLVDGKSMGLDGARKPRTYQPRTSPPSY